MAWFNFFRKKTPVITEGTDISSQINYGNQDSSVNYDSAMAVSAYFACIRVLSQSIAAMNISFYEKADANTLKKADKLYLSTLFERKVNQFQTKTPFIEQIIVNLAVSGNAYIRPERDKRGKIYSISVINSGEIKVNFIDQTLTYTHTPPSGQEITFSQDEIIHIKQFGNGIVGDNPLTHMSRTINTATQLDLRSKSTAENGGKAQGSISVDASMTEEGITRFKKRMAGASKDSLMVLPQGMTYQSFGMSPSGFQLEERKSGNSRLLAC